MPDLIPSVEKLAYSVFQKTYTAYRPGQIPGMLVDLKTSRVQLPTMSTLHTVNHFLNATPSDDIDPDVDNPLIQHEQWTVFFQHMVSIPDMDSHPFPVGEHYSFMIGKSRSRIQAFFAQHKHLHRMVSASAVEGSKNALLWYDYAALEKIRITGRFSEYRRFDVLLRAILDKAADPTSHRYQFIEIPLSDRLYNRAQLLPAFRKLDPSTIKIKNDPSLFFLIHLLGMVYGRTTLLDVTPWPADVTAWHQAGGDVPVLRSTSLFDRIDRAISDRLHIILTHADRAVIYNLGDLQHFAESNGFFNKVLRHINTLKLSSLGAPVEQLHAMTDDEFDKHVDAAASLQAQAGPAEQEAADTPLPVNLDEIHNKADTTPTPPGTITTPVIAPTPITRPVLIKEPVLSTGHEILAKETKALKAALDATYHADSSQHKRADTLYQRHLSAVIGTKTIEQHLTQTPDPQINQGSLEFLKDTLPDPSMATSSIADFDRSYIGAMHQKDMARTLTSFVNQGFFVSDIKQDVDANKFNQTTTYKVRLIDVEGKSHSVQFTLPHVDQDGQMLVNGVTTRMVKQQINLPIVKVDPTRVNLSSNYNKVLVERTANKTNSYATAIVKYLNGLRKASLITVQYGKRDVDHTPLPYEYSVISQTFSKIIAGEMAFSFDYEHRFDGLLHEQVVVLLAREKQYGVYCGQTNPGDHLFWDAHDAIHQVSSDGKHQDSSLHFIRLLSDLLGEDLVSAPRHIAEWTNVKILDKVIPIILMLGYQYGLSAIFAQVQLKSRFVAKGDPLSITDDEIRVIFADGSLVFSRYPLQASLIASGLLWMDTSQVTLAELDHPDVYYEMLSNKGLSINLLKGVAGFFRFFIDPITFDVLQHMGEPTDPKDLLLRASSMLATEEFYPAASIRHHRMRGYERFSGVLYNEMSRAMATYQNQRYPNKSYSINPQAVFQRIVQDQTVMNADVINPVHELKGVTQGTFNGSGGRTSQSFVVDDRQYPEDGVGVMSEATPDSGKVAMTFYTTSDPRIKNIRGMLDHNDNNRTSLPPGEMLSMTSMLMPASVQDDCLV